MALSLATIQNYMAYAATTEYLAVLENGRNKALNGGEYEGDKDIPFLLHELYEVVDWASQFYEGKPELDKVVYYMYALCSKYMTRVQAIKPIAPVNPIVIPTPTDKPKYPEFPKIQYVIGIPNTFMGEGDAIVSVQDKGIIENSLVVTVDGVRLPYDVDSVMSFQAIYSLLGVKIYFNQVAQIGQVYIIEYEKLSS